MLSNIVIIIFIFSHSIEFSYEEKGST